MNYEIDISEVTLRTQRLILRPWRQSDLDDFYEYAKVDGVGNMAGWAPHPNKEKSQEVLNIFIEEKNVFALEHKGRVIGSIGIHNYKDQESKDFYYLKCREIGFVLSKDYWGLGLMPEAVNEVIRYLFEEVGLDVIIAGHFLWNKQSERVQEKCGFKHYKFGKYKTRTGTIEDHEIKILIKKDWDHV